MPDPFKTGASSPLGTSPFKPGAGKVPPAFGGRDEPLLTAKAMVDRLAVPSDPVAMPLLRGVRGVGKTALMAYVRHHAVRVGAVALHIEADPSDTDLVATCQALSRDAAPLASAGRDLARRLSSLSIAKAEVAFHPPGERAEANLEALIHDLVLLADAAGRGLMLTVDEVHEAEDLLLRPLVRAIHRHAQDSRPFAVMLSGLPGAADRLLTEGQTYTERLTSHDLGMLDLLGVAEALREPFVDDAGVDVDEEVIDHVHADSGGYPYFVQLWGEALWDVLPARRGVRLADAVRAQRAVDVRRDDFFGRRWRRFPTGRARALARELARQGGTARMSDLARGLGYASQRVLSDPRATLIAGGHLYSPAYGRVAFTVPGFGPWLLAQPDDDA
ncbi:MAG: AAA family ATPase [Nitriliruptoraceae bacterium]